MGADAERSRRTDAWSALLLNGAARALNVAAQLVFARAILGQLGTDGYSAWLVVAGALAYAPGLDLGAGFALLARVGRAYGRGDRSAQQAVVARALRDLVALALVACVAVSLWPGDVRGPWGAVRAALLLLFAVLPCAVAPRIQLALRRGREAGAWALVGSVASAAAMGVVLQGPVGLHALALAQAGGIAVTQLGSALQLFGWQRRDLLSAVRAPAPAPGLRRDMLGYTLLFASSWLASAADPLLARRILGDAASAQLGFSQQWLLLPAQVVGLAVQPLSSAFAEQIGRADRAAVRATLRRALAAAVLWSAACGAGLACLGPALIVAWSRGAVALDPWLLAGLVVSGTCSAAGAVASALMNAAGRIVPQVLMAAALIPSALGLKAWALSTYGVGALGWAQALAYLACALAPYAILIPTMLRSEDVR